MRTVLICLRGSGIPSLLDAVAATLAPDVAWLLCHVVDTRPIDEVTRTPSGEVRENTQRMVPSLPLVSMPCSTSSSLRRPSACSRV